MNSKFHLMVSCKIKPFLKDYGLIRNAAGQEQGVADLYLETGALNLSLGFVFCAGDCP